MTQLGIDFTRNGPDVRKEDAKRFGRQLQAVLGFMRDGQPRTLREIAEAVHAPEPSVSARLRNLRALGHVVERKRIASGLFSYRLVLR